MLRKLLVIATVLCLDASRSTAQEVCARFMQFGIYDQYNTLSTRTEYRLFQNWFCESHFRTASEAKSAGTSLGISIPIIGDVDFGNESNQSRFESARDNFCRSTYDQQSSNANLQQAIRSVSPALMSVVRSCLETQQSGFAGWIETSRDRKTFTYKARYRPLGNERVQIDSFDIQPVAVRQSCSVTAAFPLFQKPHRVTAGAQALTCTVDPKTTVTVTLNLKDGGGGEATLDGLEPDAVVVDTRPRHVQDTYTVAASGYSTARQWLETGLVLPAGTKLTITASGTACLGPGVCQDANGRANAHPQCAARGITCGALFGKIGRDGSPFFIGKGPFNRTLTAESGSLFLGYADIDFENNSGELMVVVQADEPPPVAAAAPGQHGRSTQILDVKH